MAPAKKAAEKEVLAETTAEKTETAKKASKKAEQKPQKKAEKKAAAAAGTKKAEAPAHIFEIGGDQVSTADIEKKIYDAYKAEGHRIGNIKSLQIYYNFAERKAYYVVNGKAEDKFVEF